MASYKRITATNIALLAASKLVKGFSLIAAAAAATLEVFDGAFGKVATIAVGAAGTGYSADDMLTLAQANSGVQATVRVLTVGAGGEVLTVALSNPGTGYIAGNTYATTVAPPGGTGATITVSTVLEKFIGVLKCPINDSREMVFKRNQIDAHDGISVKLTGAAAEGYLYYN